MNRPNITPGPWIAAEFGVVNTSPASKRYVALTCAEMPGGGGIIMDAQDRANRQAIAALPDCLRALELEHAWRSASTLEETDRLREEAALARHAALIKAGYTF